MKKLTISIAIVIPFLTIVAYAFQKTENISDIINIVMTAATVAAVIVALFSLRIETFFYSPEISVEISKEHIDAPFAEDIHIRGIIRNKGNRTAQMCRLRIKEITTDNGCVNGSQNQLSSGYLAWAGDGIDPISLSPGEDRIFDIGKVWGGPTIHFSPTSFVSDKEMSVNLDTGQYVFTIHVFGDNFRPVVSKTRIEFSNKDSNHITIKPA